MKKPIYFLLGILLIFVIVYLLLIQKEKKTFAPEKMENFLELDSAQVNRIEFQKYGTKLVFRKVKDFWYISQPDSFRADRNAIGQLLSSASHLEAGELISSNREKQVFFQVDSFTGTGLDFFSGEKRLASVVLGKTSSDLLHGYLRKTNSDDVYLVKSLFSRLAERRIDKWRDRIIFPFDPKQIKEMELSLGNEKYKLTKEDTLWRVSLYPYQESYSADGKLVEDYVQSLANMKADDFATKPEIATLDFQKFEFLLAFTFQDGHTEKLFVTRREQTGDRYYVKSDKDNSIFVLFEYNLKRLVKKPDDFRYKKEN